MLVRAGIASHRIEWHSINTHLHHHLNKQCNSLVQERARGKLERDEARCGGLGAAAAAAAAASSCSGSCQNSAITMEQKTALMTNAIIMLLMISPSSSLTAESPSSLKTMDLVAVLNMTTNMANTISVSRVDSICPRSSRNAISLRSITPQNHNLAQRCVRVGSLLVGLGCLQALDPPKQTPNTEHYTSNTGVCVCR